MIARWNGFVVPIFILLALAPIPPKARALETFTTEELIDLLQEIDGKIGDILDKK